jgi:hypothetical protein
MGGLSLLLGDSGGVPLVAGSNGEEAKPGGSDRMRGVKIVTPMRQLAGHTIMSAKLGVWEFLCLVARAESGHQP